MSGDGFRGEMEERSEKERKKERKKGGEVWIVYGLIEQ